MPENIVLKIAESFNPSIFFTANSSTNHSPFKSILTGNNKIKSYFAINDTYNQPAFYIVNFESNAGFLFVSADYNISPILAFIEKGEFKKDIVPAGLIKWVSKPIDNIETVRKGLYDNTASAKLEWDNYFIKNGSIDYSINNNFRALGQAMPPPPPPMPSNVIPTSVSIGPLLPVTWGQECSFNELCGDPSVNYNCTDFYNCSTRPCTGCVATATAQVIKYWQPTNVFNYNYSSMPSTYGNIEVQRLMRDVGQSVGMNYNCNLSGGSGADGSQVTRILKNSFGLS